MVIIRSLIEITELQKAVHTYGIPVVFTSWLVSGIRDKKVKGAWYVQLVKMHIERLYRSASIELS